MEGKMGFSRIRMAGFLIAGAALGSAVTLLFAPQSGAQTRKNIRRFSKKTAKQIDDLRQDVRDQVSDGYEQAMEAIDNVKEYVKDGKSGLKKIIKTV
jgi:gas vesicle protein